MGLINAFSGIFGCLAQGAGALSAVLPALAERLSTESEAATQGTGAQGEAVGGCAALVATSGLPFHLISSLPHRLCNSTVASSRKLKLLLSTVAVTMRAGGRLREQGCG